MNKKPLVATLIVIVALIIGFNIFAFTGIEPPTTPTTPTIDVPPTSEPSTAPTTPSTTPTPKPSTKPTTPPPTSGISLTTLAAHDTKDDCWVVYKGKVYDITSFLPKHAGGTTAISRYCGKEGFESAFQKQHGNSKADLFMKVTTYEGDLA